MFTLSQNIQWISKSIKYPFLFLLTFLQFESKNCGNIAQSMNHVNFFKSDLKKIKQIFTILTQI